MVAGGMAAIVLITGGEEDLGDRKIEFARLSLRKAVFSRKLCDAKRWVRRGGGKW